VGENSTHSMRCGKSSGAIRSSANIFEASRRDKPQYFVDVVKDKRTKKIILNSSSGGVTFLTRDTLDSEYCYICSTSYLDLGLPTIKPDKRSLLIRSCC